MADRKNVIKGLEDIVDFFDVMSVIETRCNELKQEAEDAISLLKEQEPVEPIIEQKVLKYARCGKCGRLLHWQGNYCHWCGKEVKWGA